MAGRPNKTWRVLHRVTYVERPALMGFGRDIRKPMNGADEATTQDVMARVERLAQENRELSRKMARVLELLEARPALPSRR
ncbi:MAG: hypothetical protein HC872_06535 [Gammaproteobacteria bacterium]|nr:hypothetical protein [Gammaproteobacteria bacterium]